MRKKKTFTSPYKIFAQVIDFSPPFPFIHSYALLLIFKFVHVKKTTSKEGKTKNFHFNSRAFDGLLRFPLFQKVNLPPFQFLPFIPPGGSWRLPLNDYNAGLRMRFKRIQLTHSGRRKQEIESLSINLKDWDLPSGTNIVQFLFLPPLETSPSSFLYI